MAVGLLSYPFSPARSRVVVVACGDHWLPQGWQVWCRPLGGPALAPSPLQHCPPLVRLQRKGQIGKLWLPGEKRHWAELFGGATSSEPAGLGGGTGSSLFG